MPAAPHDGGAQHPAKRGATVPWDEYEAEEGETNAVVLPPSTKLGDVQAEASGRRAVRLQGTGDYVEITAAHAANSIVVRYSIPDAPSGGGIDSTLDVYVDGAMRVALDVTSRYSWFYAVDTWQNAGPALPSEDPSQGGAFHFYDEARALIGDVAAGAKVRIQKDAGNAADFYVIDLVDLEQVDPPRMMPAGFLSITDDCGATADDGGDDGQKIQDCINRARTEGKGVFIPPGTFDVASQLQSNMGIMVSDVTIAGAGMWYSVLHGLWAQFYCTGNNCRFSDFAIRGETTTRDDSQPFNGFNGSAGTGSRLDRIWVEHKKAGFWVGLDAQPSITDGLVIADSRFRDLFADGVNLCNGTRNSEIVNTHFRYTGDDAVASWAYASTSDTNSNDTIHFNSVQLPWRANCFAVYGGSDTNIEDNVCSDTLTFPGIQVGGPYAQHAFGGTTHIRRNTLVRAGGFSFNQKHGALKLFSYQVDLTGIAIEQLDIEAPTYFGIDLQSWDADTSAIGAAAIDRVAITSPGEYGVQVRSDARGSASFTNVSVTDDAAGGLSDQSAGQFELQRGSGNSGW